MTAYWRGTYGNAFEWNDGRHCACQFGPLGAPLAGCPAHLMPQEQPALDGLRVPYDGRRCSGRQRHGAWR
jgi:hypothetical protein